MCDPTSAVVALSIGSSLMGAYSQYQTGKANQSVANANADAQEVAARDAINTGNAQADQRRQQARQLAGKQTATMGASGADLSTGNALDIFGDTAAGGELDALTTVNNAQRQAAGLEFQAGVSRTQGAIQKQSGNMGAFTTLLNAPLSAYGAYKTVGGAWSPFSQKGAPISAAAGTKSVFG
ncbi:hypothetical protein CH54_1401 [Yersinia rochesterensis]|uniref:Phage protein n=1 Tax=Yersinia rochesterensis TaxID=1604335 RepID=A0ABM5SSD3_9GAMM|nr:hypothetical protein [Yersinia rochesterensis]AIN18862.1 hypothetical protein DJ57_2248 [Yersinia rochesterensis]AJI87147.1 hypothetical protein AW19_263 [Yersinia frederiksenii Y225]AJJ37474.1 hypothetical protein CH54_1401 [Yersinia rochesterensis]